MKGRPADVRVSSVLTWSFIQSVWVINEGSVFLCDVT